MTKGQWVLVLSKLWEFGEMTEFAYKVTELYSTSDYRLISDVMIEFKEIVSS